MMNLAQECFQYPSFREFVKILLSAKGNIYVICEYSNHYRFVKSMLIEILDYPLKIYNSHWIYEGKHVFFLSTGGYSSGSENRLYEKLCGTRGIYLRVTGSLLDEYMGVIR
jgi:hypothetical protein